MPCLALVLAVVDEAANATGNPLRGDLDEVSDGDGGHGATWNAFQGLQVHFDKEAKYN